MTALSQVLAIDIGGTKVLGGVVNEEGQVLATEQIPSRVEEGPRQLFRRIYEVSEKVLSRAQLSVSAVGVTAPGMVDSRTGTLIYAPFSGWRDVAVGERIARHFGLPTRVANDVNACALAEQRFGVAAGLRHFAWMTISTGIGGGIVIGGEIYEGGGLVAGEFGHLVVEDDGPLCGCGTRGCLEACASGTAIARMAKEAIEAGTETSIAPPVTAAAVADAARKGDSLARSIFAKQAFYLGKALSWIINILNPEMVVLGGGVVRAADLFLPRAREICRQRVISQSNKEVPIVETGLGYQAGLIGAASLVLDLAEDGEAG